MEGVDEKRACQPYRSNSGRQKARLIMAKGSGYSMIRDIQTQMAGTRVPKLVGVS